MHAVSSNRPPFADETSDFRRFLTRSGDDAAAGTRRFRARNFRLDEGVTSRRATDYEGGSTRAWDRHVWAGHHREYQTRHVRHRPALLPKVLDPSRPDSCAATFSVPLTRAAPLENDLLMVSVSRVQDIRPRTGESTAAVLSWLQRSVAGDPRADAVVERLLRLWPRDTRPTYATLYANVEDVLPEDAANAPAGWANALRNGLGLLHFDPGAGPIDVVVFRYEIRDIPKIRGGRGVRPLHRPTVLDGPLNSAFCPAPADCDTGLTVDLAPDPSRHVLSELAHPPLRDLLARHVFRLGKVTARVPPDLEFARAWHLASDEITAVRADYGMTTDADLLT